MARKRQYFWQFIAQILKRDDNEQAHLAKAFADDDLARRKYILSRVCEHLSKDKFEPAPLLNKRLLDIGCGTSTIPGELVLRGALVSALDVNENTVQHAEKSAQERGMDVSYHTATPEEFSKTNEEPFDIVLCLDVIEYAQDYTSFIKALDTIAAEDAVIVLTGRSHNWVARIIYKFMQPYTNHPPFPRRLQTLTKEFSKYNFERTHAMGLAFDLNTEKWHKCEFSRLRYMATFGRKGGSL